MNDYEFELPWPPSVNGYWRNWQHRQIISKRGRTYRQQAIEHLQGLSLDHEMIDIPVAVSLDLCPPTLRKYDIDNFTKGIFDALSLAQFWTDDVLVDVLKIYKRPKMKGGGVKLKVSSLD